MHRQDLHTTDQNRFTYPVPIRVRTFHQQSDINRIKNFHRTFVIGIKKSDNVDHHSFRFVDLRIDQTYQRTIIIKQWKEVLQNSDQKVILSNCLQFGIEVLLFVNHPLNRSLNKLHYLSYLWHSKSKNIYICLSR